MDKTPVDQRGEAEQQQQQTLFTGKVSDSFAPSGASSPSTMELTPSAILPVLKIRGNQAQNSSQEIVWIVKNITFGFGFRQQVFG